MLYFYFICYNIFEPRVAPEKLDNLTSPVHYFMRSLERCKMSDIVKVCLKHGELTSDQVHTCREGVSFRYKCKKCVHDHYLKTIEQRRAYSREYEKTRRIRPDPEKAKEQVRLSSLKYSRKNKDIIRAKVNAQRKENPEKFREYDRKYRRNNLEKCRLIDISKKHNITPEDYLNMEKVQRRRCAICRQKETRKSRTEGQLTRLAVDHNHTTGKIRGLLCHECNTGLGKFKENKKYLKRAAKYLDFYEDDEVSVSSQEPDTL